MSYLEMALKVSRGRQSAERVDHPENQSTTEPLQSENPAACGSPYCAGCYEVSPGVRIHPPKCGPGWVQ
jgi:hypothetical protein